MSSRNFRSIGTAWRTNLGEMPAQEPGVAEPQMSRGQVIILMQMRVPKAGPDSLYAKVLAYLRAVGSDEPDAVDYTRLREHGYIHFNGQARIDVLLPAGHHAAEREAREIAKRCGIHHVSYRFKRPRSNMGSFGWCSCGHWQQTVTRKQGDDVRLIRAGAGHLRQVENGTFKPRRPLEEFLNEMMPLQLPFNERRT